MVHPVLWIQGCGFSETKITFLNRAVVYLGCYVGKRVCCILSKNSTGVGRGLEAGGGGGGGARIT